MTKRYIVEREDVVGVGRPALWFVMTGNVVASEWRTRREARVAQRWANNGDCPVCGTYRRRCEADDDAGNTWCMMVVPHRLRID